MTQKLKNKINYLAGGICEAATANPEWFCSTPTALLYIYQNPEVAQ